MMTKTNRYALSNVETAQEAFKLECLEIFGELAQVFRVPRSVGLIYATLFASPVALSFSDLVESLDISKGSASQGLRFLRENGAIRVAKISEWAAGHQGASARYYYVPETELRKVISGILQGSFATRLKKGASRLDGFASRFDRALCAAGANGELLLFRLEKLRQWHRRGAGLLPLLGRIIG